MDRLYDFTFLHTRQVPSPWNAAKNQQRLNVPSCGAAVPGVLSVLCDSLRDQEQLEWASPHPGLMEATLHSGCSLRSSSAWIFAGGASVVFSSLPWLISSPPPSACAALACVVDSRGVICLWLPSTKRGGRSRCYLHHLHRNCPLLRLWKVQC